MSLFPKNVSHFGFFSNEMACERDKQDFSNKVIVLNATSFIYQYKNAKKRISKNFLQLIYFNYYKGKSAKEIADMFFLQIRTICNIISHVEKKGPLDLKGSTGRPKKVTQLVERKIIKTVYDSPQYSTGYGFP